MTRRKRYEDVEDEDPTPSCCTPVDPEISRAYEALVAGCVRDFCVPDRTVRAIVARTAGHIGNMDRTDILAEREACAQVVEKQSRLVRGRYHTTLNLAARAIRERGRS